MPRVGSVGCCFYIARLLGFRMVDIWGLRSEFGRGSAGRRVVVSLWAYALSYVDVVFDLLCGIECEPMIERKV
jgi:hypothetical protein